MLGASQLEAFQDRGIVRVEGLVDPGAVGAFRERVLGFLEEQGVEPATLADGELVTPSVFRPIVDGVAFEALWGPGTAAVLDQLLGPGRWKQPGSVGQVLFIAPPRPSVAWDVPHKSWHLDYAAPRSSGPLPGVQAFVCLDRVAPRSGATVAIAGSARLVDRIRVEAGGAFGGRSAEVRQRLAERAPWYADLCALRPGEDRVARFLERPTEVEGIALQVVELTGEPGDVLLVHPWTLHSLSPNCGTRPRLVVTERIHRR